MAELRRLVDELRSLWAAPRVAHHRGEQAPFLLRCLVANGATDEEIERAGRDLPQPLVDVWRLVSSARLFEDSEYGQWGLELLDPREATAETQRFQEARRRDTRQGDLVVGRFLGDADRLVIRCDSTHPDFGHVLVALPLDRREDWYHVATRFDDFLARLAETDGDKYWEIER